MKLGVTERVLVFSDGWWVGLEEVAEIKAGVWPSPHDDGGPLWGIWITFVDGGERGIGLFRPYHAARAIERQKRTVETLHPREVRVTRRRGDGQ